MGPSPSWNGAAWNQLGWNGSGAARQVLICYANPRRAQLVGDDSDYRTVNPRRAQVLL